MADAIGTTGPPALVFPRADGEQWRDDDWRSWRRRRFTPALDAARVEHAARPYDLRHSFASLLLAEGRTVHYVARQLGHAPSMTLGVNGRVIDELEHRDRVDAEAEIRAAREALVRVSYVSSG